MLEIGQGHPGIVRPFPRFGQLLFGNGYLIGHIIGQGHLGQSLFGFGSHLLCFLKAGAQPHPRFLQRTLPRDQVAHCLLGHIQQVLGARDLVLRVPPRLLAGLCLFLSFSQAFLQCVAFLPGQPQSLAGTANLTIQFRQTVALGNALSGRAWCVGLGHQPVPPPQIPLQADQPLAGFKLHHQFRTLFRLHDADLVQGPFQTVHPAHETGKGCSGRGKRGIIVTVPRPGPVNGRPVIGGCFKIVPQSGPQRHLITRRYLQCVHDGRPQLIVPDIEHPGQGFRFRFQPAGLFRQLPQMRAALFQRSLCRLNIRFRCNGFLFGPRRCLLCRGQFGRALPDHRILIQLFPKLLRLCVDIRDLDGEPFRSFARIIGQPLRLGPVRPGLGQPCCGHPKGFLLFLKQGAAGREPFFQGIQPLPGIFRFRHESGPLHLVLFKSLFAVLHQPGFAFHIAVDLFQPPVQILLLCAHSLDFVFQLFAQDLETLHAGPGPRFLFPQGNQCRFGRFKGLPAFQFLVLGFGQLRDQTGLNGLRFLFRHP